MSADCKEPLVEREDQLSACAFLFDSSHVDLPDLLDPPLAFFVESVLAALSKADPAGHTRSRLMTGLPMLHSLATRVTAVHASERSSGHTESHDLDTFKYLVWEWLDSLASTWSTIDLEQGSEIFRLHTGECVAFVSLDPAVRNLIDRELRITPGYIGGFEIDLGNPFHRVGFIENLNYMAAVINGAIVQERSYEGDEDWPLNGAAAFLPQGLRWEPIGWLDMNGPPGLARLQLSDRGAQAAKGYLRKHEETVEGRVLRAIERAYWLNPSRKAFEFTAVSSDGDILEALMPEGKFTGYLFNREHEQGGSKSAFFIDVLGIAPDDWRYLAAQFYYGLLLAEPDKLDFREWEAGYGMRFNVEMRVRGRAGQTAAVRTGWMMKPGELPALSTAVPGDRDADLPDPVEPPILPPGPQGDAEWAQLWAWANTSGVKAGTETVPTPMYLVDFGAIAEGECGTASVRVRDARRGLARWLNHHGPGETDSYGGVVVFSPISSQSRDRAIAWAREVIVTLKLNGIDAELESLDS